MSYSQHSPSHFLSEHLLERDPITQNFPKSFILQIADYEDAGAYSCPTANFSKNKGIFSTAPCIGGLLSLCLGFNILYCLIHKLIQFFFGYQLFDFVKSFYPVRVFDSLLSSEYAIHSLHPSFCLQSKRLFRITGLSKDCLLFYKLQFL